MIALERNLIDRVAAEDLRELGHLRDKQDEIREVGLDPRDLGARQTRSAVRHAERQARDAIGSDREAAAGKRKARVVGIEAVLRLRAVRALDGEQAFAAEIESQARVLDRPISGNVDRRMRERECSVETRPWLPKSRAPSR